MRYYAQCATSIYTFQVDFHCAAARADWLDYARRVMYPGMSILRQWEA
jgi:hypothetical protein